MTCPKVHSVHCNVDGTVVSNCLNTATSCILSCLTSTTCNYFLFFFFFRHYNFNRSMFCPSQHIISNYCNTGCTRSNSLFSVSSCCFLCHFTIYFLVFLMFLLTSVSIYIVFKPFSLLTFDVNGQTNLTFVILCSLLCSYVLLIYLS